MSEPGEESSNTGIAAPSSSLSSVGSSRNYTSSTGGSRYSSPAWNFFTKIIDPNAAGDNKKVTHVQCCLCTGTFRLSGDGSTSHLLKHLKAKHATEDRVV